MIALLFPDVAGTAAVITHIALRTRGSKVKEKKKEELYPFDADGMQGKQQKLHRRSSCSSRSHRESSGRTC